MRRNRTVTIVDNSGTGRAVLHSPITTGDVWDAITPWFPEAPEEVTRAIHRLGEAIAAAEPWDGHAAFLNLDVTAEIAGPEKAAQAFDSRDRGWLPIVAQGQMTGWRKVLDDASELMVVYPSVNTGPSFWWRWTAMTGETVAEGSAVDLAGAVELAEGAAGPRPLPEYPELLVPLLDRYGATEARKGELFDRLTAQYGQDRAEAMWDEAWGLREHAEHITEMRQQLGVEVAEAQTAIRNVLNTVRYLRSDAAYDEDLVGQPADDIEVALDEAARHLRIVEALRPKDLP